MIIKKLMEDGDALYNSKKFEDALVCFEKALEIDPKNALCWRDKAITLSRLGKVKDSLTCFEKALEIDPNNAHIWQQKASTLERHDKLTEAIICFEKAVDIDPMHLYAWFGKGSVLLSLKKFKDSLTCFEKALEIDPIHIPSLQGKITVSLTVMDFESAKISVDKILEINPNDKKMQKLSEMIDWYKNYFYQWAMGIREKFRDLKTVHQINKFKPAKLLADDYLNSNFHGKTLEEFWSIIDKINEDIESDDEEYYEEYEDSSYTESNEVPSDQQLKKYYATLEINESASSQEIKDAYKKLIKFYHPDKFQQIPESLKRAESKTKEIIEAYKQLKKISKKSKEQNGYTKDSTGKREKDYWRTNKESYETYDSSSKTATFDSRDTTNTYRTSEPSKNNLYQKKLDQLFWIRIIFSLVGGIYAGIEVLAEGILIVIVLYVLSIIIGKAMKIPLPDDMKNKIKTHGTGKFFVYFFVLWIFLGFVSAIYFS